MKASDYIASFLERNDIKIIFGYQGGMIAHLIDSIGNNPNLQYVQCYHEQTASIAAEGYSKGTNNIGCAISSSGPGVTNMMTGIADAYFDSIPVLYITGQVNTYEYKYEMPIRQLGFQEMEVAELVKPITKYSKMVDKVEELPYELEKAIYIAKEGRKGPVLLDIPLNIQRTELNLDECLHFEPNIHQKEVVINWDEICGLLNQAHSPMLLVGAGCIGYEEMQALGFFLERTKIPVVTSLMGKGAVNEEYEYYMGMVGSYGNRCANMAISQVDLLIALGTRLDTRQTGAKIESFIPDATIIHVNNDVGELDSNRLQNRLKVNTNVLTFLNQLMTHNLSILDYVKWHGFVLKIKKTYNQDQEIDRFVDNKSPYRMMQYLNTIFQDNDVVTVDIGQNQMWASQTLKMKNGMRFLTSGGLAPMGFSIPAAVGVAFANPEKKIYVICGDGGFHMSSQALGVIAQYHLNITIVLMNNDCLGMINQFQKLYFDSRFYGTHPTSGYKTPDFKKMAESYNIEYKVVTEDTIAELTDIDSVCPLIVEYKIDGFTEVCPKLEYNRPIYQPIPLLDEQELLRNLKIN